MIGLDIGGANTKAAVVDRDGLPRTASEPFEVWADPDGLPAAIAEVIQRLNLDDAPVALTTTAELVDVFPSKREGVLRVLDCAEWALPDRRVRVLTTAGKLIGLPEARSRPLDCAAANWIATAMVVARGVGDAILLDCGGTTTDLIPISGGEVVARGRTDLERLLEGELVYTGALRTNVAALVSQVPISAGSCPVSSELFAISADAHLLLGNLKPEQCNCSFPDGRGASGAEVRARLARVVCADPEQLDDGDLEAMATAVIDAQVDSIVAALELVTGRVGAGTRVIAVGIGAFLARAAAARCGLPVDPEADRRAVPALTGTGGEVAAAVALSVLGGE